MVFSFPTLARLSSGDLCVWTDGALARDHGVTVAFSERNGGVSEGPYTSLNLAAHVGDEPGAVDTNRDLLLETLGLSVSRRSLTMAVQVHGETISVVESDLVGAGAFADHGLPPVAAADALLTAVGGVPLALCFADCVPVVLVAPGPVVAVVHAGWRGAAVSLPGKTASELAQRARCDPCRLLAYIGAHIGACHYQVGDEIVSHFVNTFGTFARADSGGLDLDAVVTASLERAGVASCNIARLGTCTAEATDRFFSHRAEGGVTGRHAALVCIQ